MLFGSDSFSTVLTILGSVFIAVHPVQIEQFIQLLEFFFCLASTLWLEHLLFASEVRSEFERERGAITKALGWLKSNPTRECLTCDWHHKSSCNGTEGRTQLMIVVTGIRGFIPNYRTLLLLSIVSGCVCVLIRVVINYVGPSPRRLATWLVKRFSGQTTFDCIFDLINCMN